ncbi:hypothetical protein IQ65_21905 [Leptospira interrogans serovar Lai]|nr:hypothetical protein IQ65_21905 [Leptospira interrogans serovar Lai]
MSLKIKFLRKIVDLKYNLQKLRQTGSSYKILGNILDYSFICVYLNHNFGGYLRTWRLFILNLDYIKYSDVLYNYLMIEFGIFGFWLSIWIRLCGRKKIECH